MKLDFNVRLFALKLHRFAGCNTLFFELERPGKTRQNYGTFLVLLVQSRLSVNISLVVQRAASSLS